MVVLRVCVTPAAMERCNPCLMRLAGWATGGLGARHWSVAQGGFTHVAVAYPARERFNSKGEMIAEPLPPFGNRSCEVCGIPVVPPPHCALGGRGDVRARELRLPHLSPFQKEGPGASQLCFRAGQAPSSTSR